MKDAKDKLIIVTGASGFIGSGVVRCLNERGISNIIVVDELDTSEKWKNLVGKHYVDFILKDQLFSWLKGREKEIRGFIHLGACSSTVETDANYLLENNYRYSTRLAEYAIEHGHRFIYASSAATYGDGAKGFSDDDLLIDALEPLNMYGYSKHMFDLWLKRRRLLDKVVGLKYFNVFGPNEWHKGRMASAILHFCNQIKKEGAVRLFKSCDPKNFSDGGQMRDFVYVKDVARWTIDLLDSEATGIFNMGTGEANTWNTLANAVFKGLQKPVKIDYIDMPEDLVGKYQNYTCADMTKLKAATQWSLKSTPFQEAVVEYVRDYLVPQKHW